MRRTTTRLMAALALLPLAAHAHATDEATQVSFVAPPWPGVTVKTEIMAQILAPLGYTNERQELSSTVGYKTLQTGDSDVFLAGWLPAQQDSYDAAMDDGSIVDLGNNVTGARMGFAVPGYVYEAGVTSAEQLDDPENRERFEGRYYSIESGSTVSDFIHDAKRNDTYGLGDWELLESSTPGMLSAVRSAYDEKRWIAFYGWTPHWMVPEFDMHILDDPEGIYGDNQGRSDVRTIVAKSFSEANPNLMRLLDQFVLSAEQQSDFIREYGLKERKLEAVAHAWLQNHPDELAEFLDGVTTRDGEPGLAAVEDSL
ncbi:ABC transporter substrate-binding protein [Chromohalobacter nigrandesensis]|uniref:ABC transporter substrate-binding protein n=1 Tax=Chromohalobacter nigrandesensis TaxID=119863 RepID=UPI001FF1906E|nr:ABC transporter substrate-binding protein [Chromohalobacter nigrandesensis]MCK0745439.1 ABC transporter substrate-binding protein [Chromohalobacter nigrandesensis]